MTGRPIIRVGDQTTHGGTVMEGFSSYSIDGRAAAGLGHNVECPTCNGIYPIVEGVSSFTIDGGYVAIEGMRTACGATLIASQNIASVIPDSGGIARVSRNWRTREKELREGGAGSERPHSDVLRQSSCEHADTAVIPAEYIVREMKTNPFSIRGRQIHDSNHFDFGSYSRQWSESPGMQSYRHALPMLRRWPRRNSELMLSGPISSDLGSLGITSRCCKKCLKAFGIRAGKSLVPTTISMTFGRTFIMAM